ncbi:MAG: T9SS type A sorting domain-containing protein [Bacteroidia bacterium]
MKTLYIIILMCVFYVSGEAQCNALINPLTKTLTCNGLPASFTASPTGSATVGQWFDAGNVPVSVRSNSLVTMVTSNPGVYFYIAKDTITMCTVTKSVTVLANPAVPSMTVNALAGTSLSCSVTCLPFNISVSIGPVPKTYSWTNVSTSVTATPATGSYTICSPGTYIATYEDGNACIISETIYISGTPCTTGLQEWSEAVTLSIQPNPNTGQFNLKLRSELRNAELIIMNSLGQRMHQQIILQGDNQVNVPAAAKGIYYYTVSEDKRIVKSGKLLID